MRLEPLEAREDRGGRREGDSPEKLRAAPPVGSTWFGPAM